MMLELLGQTADEVAATLRARGIQGVRNTVRFLNPVVRFAHSLLTDARGIDLIQGTEMRMVFADGREVSAEVPPAVLQFLEAFHRGDYPDLELPPREG
jgi:hypothetical protein